MLTQEEENKLEHALAGLRSELTTKIERRRQKDELELRLTDAKATYDAILDEERNYKQSRLFVIKYQNDKRKKDSESIKTAMKVASELVWQKNPINPRFEHKPGRYPESNLIVNKGDRVVLLETTEGTGVAESISILTLLSVLNATPYIKTLFLDEYFSSVSPSNSERLSRSLNELIDGKFQLTLIEQKDQVVEHARYREFRIDHNGIHSSVTTYEVDEQGNRRQLTEEELQGGIG